MPRKERSYSVSIRVYVCSGPAILGYPLIVCQRPIGNDVLTNVAIVVMRLVGLAPASVEQCNTCRHASCVGRLVALGNLHQVSIAVVVCARDAGSGALSGELIRRHHAARVPLREFL